MLLLAALSVTACEDEEETCGYPVGKEEEYDTTYVECEDEHEVCCRNITIQLLQTAGDFAGRCVSSDSLSGDGAPCGRPNTTCCAQGLECDDGTCRYRDP